MLILTRKLHEKIIIGANVWVKVISIKGAQVLIGIEAPKDISVNREEVQDRIDSEGSLKESKKWGEIMQIYDMLDNRYRFSVRDTSLHYISHDGAHEGKMTLTMREHANLLVNVKRLIDVLSKTNPN